MLFKIINPSDPYTLKSERFDIAAIACLILGQGQYALEGIDTNLETPMFKWAEWMESQFNLNIKDDKWLYNFLNKGDNRADLIKCFRSVLINDREVYETALGLIEKEEDKIRWAEYWHDKHRSSMNNIGARAFNIAKKLEEENA